MRLRPPRFLYETLGPHMKCSSLPRELSETGVALYDDSVIDLVKAPRGDGVDAAFAHDAKHRSWVGEKSAELVIALIVGIVEVVSNRSTSTSRLSRFATEKNTASWTLAVASASTRR